MLPCHAQVRFKDLFDSFDADRSGTLEIRELAQLVKQLVSGVTVPELKYIMVGALCKHAQLASVEDHRACNLGVKAT